LRSGSSINDPDQPPSPSRGKAQGAAPAVLCTARAGFGTCRPDLVPRFLDHQYAITNAQDEKNEFLKREIASLDKEIDEIKKIQEQTNALLARKRVIEALQANRTETVHLFNELAKQVPEGIYLRTLVQTGQKIVITGYAQSNARITTLMNNLDESPLLERSTGRNQGRNRGQPAFECVQHHHDDYPPDCKRPRQGRNDEAALPVDCAVQEEVCREKLADKQAAKPERRHPRRR
jgi:hypothetical protein